MRKLEIGEMKTPVTTIGLHRITKARLDKHRAPGQCYDGFICQLVDLWEDAKKERINYVAGPAGGNQGAVSSR